MYKDTAKEVTIELSSFCQLNCIHCSTWYSSGYSYIEEYIINVDSVIDISIKHIKSTPNISIRIRLSGGEPLSFVNREIFERMKKECPNIKEWIITTSGSFPTILEDFAKTMNGFEDKIVYRISLYGNKDQHTRITRNFICYDNAINSLEWLTDNGYDVELTSPIFGFNNVLNVVKTARKYKVPIRFAKLISTPILRAPSQRYQLLVARIMKILYRKAYLTCSLYGQCKKLCDYPKSTILATSKIIGCAVDKLPKYHVDPCRSM